MTQITKPKLLLHVCCAPDSTVAVERLGGDYDINIFFYNPNIHPVEEYRKRADEMSTLAPKLGVSCHIGKYDANDWFALTAGLEDEPEKGRRCEVCFRMRLNRTVDFAAEHNFDLFATVLTVSPHKNAELINRLGREIGRKFGVEYLESNFKKKDGFKRSIELSKKFGLYRQDYCGCIYSKTERETQKHSKSKQ